MKSSRIIGAIAIAGASALALTGCFQLPTPPVIPTSAPETGGQTDGGQTDGGQNDGGQTDGAVELAGTSWTGTDSNTNVMTFTLDQDGTVTFEDWNNGSFDSPTDVWSVTGDQFSMTVTDIRDNEGNMLEITYSGTAALGSMSLRMQGTDGSSGSLNLTQQ